MTQQQPDAGSGPVPDSTDATEPIAPAREGEPAGGAPAAAPSNPWMSGGAPTYQAPPAPVSPQPVPDQGPRGPRPFGEQPYAMGGVGASYMGASAFGTGYQQPAPAPAQSAPRSSRRGVVALVAAAALLAGAAGGAVGATIAGTDDSPAATASQGSPGGSVNADQASVVTGSVAGAAATIMPSTVVIEVTGNGSNQFGMSQQTGGTGSGVVLDTQGHILTNAHVVTAGGSVRNPSITVTFSDGTTAEASVVGIDESSDLAVIKVDANDDLVPASFADSDALQIGQTVVAVGAPLGLSGTVTEGIVSAVDRPVRTGESADASTVLDAVQTDAAINPGNSGGPLVDLSGAVVGINSAIATVSSSGGEAGNIGVGFAIPSNDAKIIADQLIENGVAVHASLGVTASETQDASGAEIRSVEPGSAAAEAGIEAGDVVTAVGDRHVRDLDGLLAAVRDYQPGDEVGVTVLRDGSELTLTVTLGSREG